MSSPPTIIVESHRSAATLYATGELTTAGVLEAVAYVERLPEHVRALCVDLRGVRRTDSNALRALDLALRTWRALRRGTTRVKPAQDMETSLVAIKFTHRRWTPSPRHSTQLLGGLAAFDSAVIARPS